MWGVRRVSAVLDVLRVCREACGHGVVGRFVVPGWPRRRDVCVWEKACVSLPLISQLHES